MEKAILVAHKEDDSVNEALELCESAGYCACVAAEIHGQTQIRHRQRGTRKARRDGRKVRS